MADFFFELLRVALGVQSMLSRKLSKSEWKEVYNISKKQALVGVCFAGVQRLPEKQRPEELLYLQWMGMAAKIQQRNEMLNRQCTELCVLLDASQMECSILKGQAFGSLYGSMSRLRQPGDIDVWVKGSPHDVIKWGKSHGVVTFYDYHHADFSCESYSDVELHYRPSLSRNLIRNYKLQRWFDGQDFSSNRVGRNQAFPVPDNVFNIVLALNHNFWHLMYEGIGLRQFVDLYFILKSIDCVEREQAYRLVKSFDLLNFASASMYVMQTVLGLEDDYLLVEPNPEEGAFLLSEVIQAGNFGRYDSRVKLKQNEGKLTTMVRWCEHNLRLLRHYPKDVLWTPIGVMYISLWKRLNFKLKTN